MSSVLWVCGPRGVGKSTVAREIFSQVTREGVEAAYIDMARLTFRRSRSADKGRILQAAWENHRLAGATCLVVSGEYVDVWPSVAVAWLRADPVELAERLLRRGDGPPFPEAPVEDGGVPDYASFCLDTTGMTVADTVFVVRDALDWP